MSDWLDAGRHPQLPVGCDADHPLERLRASLRSYPWQWPDPEVAPRRVERAKQISKLDGPPRLRPGVVPIVTYSERGVASLWALDPHAKPQRGVETRPWDAEVHDVWRTALTAVNRRAAALWTSTQRLALPTAAIHIASTAWDHSNVVREPVLRDQSFGLAFALSILSQLLGEPIPDDMAMSGVIDARGRVLPVREAEKLELLSRCAPRIGRWIAGPRAEDPASPERYGLAVHRCSDLSEAFKASGLDAEKTLDRKLQAADRDGITQLVRDLFLTAVRGGEYEWTGYEQAIQCVRRAGLVLSETETQRLDIADAIVLRHQAKRYAQYPIPSPALLKELHRPTREMLIAHLVQSAADEAIPERMQALKIADEALSGKATEDLTNSELRILGARARLTFTLGRAEQALVGSKEAAKAYFVRGLADHVSYLLSFWYRCVGAMGATQPDRSLLAEPDALFERLKAGGLLRPIDETFVLTSRAAAMGLLGQHDRGTTEEVANVVRDERASTHLRRSALRAFFLQCIASNGARDRAGLDALYGVITDSPSLAPPESGEDNSRARSAAVIALDYTVACGDEAQAEAAMARLLEVCDRLLGDVRTTLPTHGSVLAQANVLRSFFPY